MPDTRNVIDHLIGEFASSAGDAVSQPRALDLRVGDVQHTMRAVLRVPADPIASWT
jgi:hypothetical protein